MEIASTASVISVGLDSIASNVYCNADMQYSARTVQIFVATYVVITFLETCDVNNSAAIQLHAGSVG